MDPITPGIISGLIVNAVTALTSRLTHRQPSATLLTDNLRKDLEGKSPRYRLPLAAELSSLRLASGDEHRFIQFLNSQEAITFAREVSVAVILDEFADTSEQFAEQANALLQLTAAISKESAKQLAPKYCETLQATYERCLALLSTMRNEDVEQLRTIARAEKAAGYLKNLAQRTSIIKRQSPDSLAEILEFVNSYVRLAHSRNAEVVPAHISDQRGVPLDMLYVQPHLLVPVSDKKKTIPLSEFASNIHRDVVLGDPGAGKSTLGQKIIYDLTARHIERIQAVPLLVTLRDFHNY